VWPRASHPETNWDGPAETLFDLSDDNEIV
jgi:hypothetical protein